MSDPQATSRAEPPPVHGGAPLRAKLAPVLILTGIFFVNFLGRIVLGPLLPVMEADLGLTHGEAGSLILLVTLGYCPAISCSGFVASRLTHRRTIVLSTLAVAVSLLVVCASHSLWGIRLGLVLVGMSAGLYLASGMAALTRLVHAGDWGKAIAIHELAPNLGFIVAPFLAQALVGPLGWRGVLAVLAGASLAGGWAFARFGKAGAFAGVAPTVRAVRALASEGDFWIMVAVFSLGIGCSLGVYMMLPLYLVTERGWSLAWANSAVALSRVSAVGMTFVAGWAADRLGARTTMGGVFLFTGGLTILLGASPDGFLAPLVFLQPMLAVCFFPAAFSALSRVGSAELRGLAVALTIPLAFLAGGGLVPAGIGYLGEVGSFSAAVMALGAIMVGGALLPRCLSLGGDGGRDG